MNRPYDFDYYVPTNEDVYATCRNWKLSFDACKSDWVKISEAVVSTYEAVGFKLKNFMVPRFRFNGNAPKGWGRHPDGLYSPPESIAAIAFSDLPIPESFTSVCMELGFPDITETGLEYWLLWTPKGRLVISAPNQTLFDQNGIEDNASEFYSENFTQVSKARYNYWVAKETLELNDEIPD
jgi:hypothetical protein